LTVLIVFIRRRLEKDFDSRLEEVRADAAEAPHSYSEETLASLAAFDEDEIPTEVIEGEGPLSRHLIQRASDHDDIVAELVLRIDEDEGEGAILIFVPGWEDITKLHQALSALPQAGRWKLFPLHSQLPMDQQRCALSRRLLGRCWGCLSQRFAGRSSRGRHRESVRSSSRPTSPRAPSPSVRRRRILSLNREAHPDSVT
jgi:hypothetical protein